MTVWKKNEPETQREAHPPAASAARPAERERDQRTAWIGPSLGIKGELTGSEDLVIEGQLEGKVDLKKHNVTVGRKGRVKADIFGRSIRVEGEVNGNLWGSEEVIIRQSGRVEGNLTAPRVTLENGARFRGSIDMDGSGASEPETASTSKDVDSKPSPQPSTVSKGKEVQPERTATG